MTLGIRSNIGSSSSLKGVKGAAAYAASKHALVGYSKSIALEYASEHIRVNVVTPGESKFTGAQAQLD